MISTKLYVFDDEVDDDPTIRDKRKDRRDGGLPNFWKEILSM